MLLGVSKLLVSNLLGVLIILWDIFVIAYK